MSSSNSNQARTDRSRSDGRDGVYLVGAGDGRESGRAIGISLLGIDCETAATFFPGRADAAKAWDRWLKRVFEPHLAPAFVEIFTATGRMRIDRVVARDRSLGERLAVPAARRSLAAAAPFLDGRAEIRHFPQWTKFRDRLDAGETPGHVTSLFALQAALFHLPLLQALVSYLYFEWRSGLGPATDVGVARFQRNFPESLAAARRAFEREAGAGGLTSI